MVAWGHANAGGDSSAVQDQLRGVVQIQAAGMAFTVILADGSVVTLGFFVQALAVTVRQFKTS